MVSILSYMVISADIGVYNPKYYSICTTRQPTKMLLVLQLHDSQAKAAAKIREWMGFFFPTVMLSYPSIIRSWL